MVFRLGMRIFHSGIKAAVRYNAIAWEAEHISQLLDAIYNNSCS